MSKILKEKLHQLNNDYYELRLKLLKMNAKPDHFKKLKVIRKKHEEKLINDYGDCIDQLNTGKVIFIKK
jgi:hypothetical protein